jgi:hypothetical protein
MKEAKFAQRAAGGSQGLIGFLTVESIEKAKIKNANPKSQFYFDTFTLDRKTQ